MRWKLERGGLRLAVLCALSAAALGACSSAVSGSASSAGSAGEAPLASGGSAGAVGSPQGGLPNAISGSPGMTGSGSGGDASSFSGGGSGSGGDAPVGAGTGGLIAGASGMGAASNQTSGAGGVTSGGGSAGQSAGAGAPPANCNLSTPVSFQKDIQGFLGKSCGKGVSSGCHVTDSNKTNLGYNHAYDWITAIAHTGSCGKTPPYAKRFEVVMAVIAGAKPMTCPNSRKMPPPDAGATPLTACDIAALQAWLAEPQVLQTHVTVSDETASLYPAGPYAMPPFN